MVCSSEYGLIQCSWYNQLRIESSGPLKVLKVGRLYVELFKIYGT